MGVAKAQAGWTDVFAPFRVTRTLMDLICGPETVFMHDLPAVRGEDVDSDILDGPRSLAWVQAENKMFSAMAAMDWCGNGHCSQIGVDSERASPTEFVQGGAPCH
jgi:ornithine carbamoyltransferase